MPTSIRDFFSAYSPEVYNRALKVRSLIIEKLPGITEQIDLSAKMVAYGYGPKYRDMICVIIPSKKGLKLGFNRGTELPDPHHLLEGTGKISRYIVIHHDTIAESPALKELLASAGELYNQLV
jgi:hypothetical protein